MYVNNRVDIPNTYRPGRRLYKKKTSDSTASTKPMYNSGHLKKVKKNLPTYPPTK